MPDTAIATAPPVDHEHPWLGLLSFGEDHTKYFFGRERELDDLFERVRRETLTILYGPSGLGKTSLLQAGLCPRLRASGLVPVLIRLRYPGRADAADAETPPPLVTQVVQKIAATLRDLDHPRAADLAASAADGSAPSLWELFHDPVWGLIGPRAPRLALLFDQFEEIFTLGEDEARARQDATALREALADLVENRPPPALDRQLTADATLAERFVFEPSPSRVLLVLREDYLARLERWRRDLPSLMRNRLELRLLSGPQALQAVVQPGCLGPRPLVSEAVGAAIVRTVAAVADDVPLDEIDAVPPLLSLLCRELNDLRLKDHAAEITGELVTSRRGDILQRYYDQCFANHPPAVRAVVEDLLLSPAGYRESSSFDTVATELRRRAKVIPQSIIDSLIASRLITAETRAGQRRLELTHDVLASLAKKCRDVRRAREEQVAAQRAYEREKNDRERTSEYERRLRVKEEQQSPWAILAFAIVVAVSVGWILTFVLLFLEPYVGISATSIGVLVFVASVGGAILMHALRRAKASGELRAKIQDQEDEARMLSSLEGEVRSEVTNVPKDGSSEALRRHWRTCVEGLWKLDMKMMDCRIWGERYYSPWWLAEAYLRAGLAEKPDGSRIHAARVLQAADGLVARTGLAEETNANYRMLHDELEAWVRSE